MPNKTTPRFVIKRVYDSANSADGFRVLVDRLWPRGLTKEAATLDEWRKDLAPSPQLRTWFADDPEKFVSFGKKYLAELHRNEAVDQFLDETKKRSRVTLLYGARDPAINHAVILQTYLTKRAL